MEELATTESIRKEILDDARKRAEHVLRQADAEVARIEAEGAAEAQRSAQGMMANGAERARREREELLARIPLEKERYRSQFAENRLRVSLGRFMDGLEPERVAELSSRLLRRAAPLLTGKAIVLRHNGIGAALAEKAFAECLGEVGPVELREDSALVANGLVVEAAGGELIVRATMDLVEEVLIDRHRGELADALFGKAAS